MDVVERLTFQAAHADTLIACEHRHRYQFAAALCAVRHVLDLCCGSGYGSAILAGQASSVVGVDNDVATIETAAATVGRHVPRVSFEAADALSYLREDLAQSFDVIVCFEGLEHLAELGEVLGRLQQLAKEGMAVIASVPNGRLFEEANPFHLTQFGYDEAVRALAGFPEAIMLPQYLAEGSLICPPDARAAEVAVILDDRDELEYANHFILTSNVDPEQLLRTHRGDVQVTVSPVYNRWAEGMRRALWALEAENARLARAQFTSALDQAGSRPAASWLELGTEWRISLGERAALGGLLAEIRPTIAVETGSGVGETLRRLVSGDVAIYPDIEVLQAHREASSGSGSVVGFALVNPSACEGRIAKLISNMLDTSAVDRGAIVVSNASDEKVRAALESIEYEKWSKVQLVDLGFVPGKADGGSIDGQPSGGLALIVFDSRRSPDMEAS